MSSNSIRVGAELFLAAQQEGALMSRSAAQQIEHWARVGVALEQAGLSIADVAGLLRSRGTQSDAARTSEPNLWAFKRELQARDLHNVRAGRLSGAQMSWFSGGKASAVKLPNSPY
jgi:hypothetical protein